MKKYISLVLIAIAVAGGSCKKTFLSDLAANPNLPSTTSANLQLSAALTQCATLTTGTDKFRYMLWDNYLSWSTNVQPSPPILQYSITQSSFDSFTPTFTNINNFNAILTATTDPNMDAIANIMLVYDFQQLVDQYGNVPYSQALKGIAQLSPAYDDQSAIYDAMLVQLDASIKAIQGAPATAQFPGKYDVMFGATNAAGMLKWAQFANTLKLRLALRQSSNSGVYGKKSAALIASLAATNAVGYLSGTIEGAVNPTYSATDPYESTLDVALGTTAAGKTSGNHGNSQANTYFLNLLVGTGTQAAPNDPRILQIYAPSTTASVNTTIITTKLGETSPPQVGGVTVNPSFLSKFLVTPTKSSYLIMGSESFFLQAEAAEIGIIPGGTVVAAADYLKGVEASFVELGLTAAQADTYVAAYAPYPAGGAPLAPGGTLTDLKQQAIHTQKYIALFGYEPLESYLEILRTGLPKVPTSIQPGVLSTTYVERMLYPTAEYNYNTANALAQGTITPYTPKIFWEP